MHANSAALPPATPGEAAKVNRIVLSSGAAAFPRLKSTYTALHAETALASSLALYGYLS